MSNIDKPSSTDKKDHGEHFFDIDPTEDAHYLKSAMQRFPKNYGTTVYFIDTYRYESAKDSYQYKYTDEQVATLSFEEEDRDDIFEEAKKVKTENFFSRNYEFVSGPAIQDSFVRLDQEKNIVEDLRKGKPTLIRGFWRIGKTSMHRSIITHHYPGRGTEFEARVRKGDDAETFLRSLGLDHISEMLALYEHADQQLSASALFKEEQKISKEIIASGKHPLQYLSEYGQIHDEQFFIGIDETIVLAPEHLSAIAGLANLPNIHLSVVYHYVDRLEQRAKIFREFATHFIRPLTLQETAEIFIHPYADADVKLTESAQRILFEYTGGRPWEIQMIARELFTGYQLGLNKPKLIIEAQDIGECILHRGYRFASDIRGNYRRIITTAISSEDRALLENIARNTSIPNADIEPEQAQKLQNLMLIRAQADDKHYTINGGLLADVILENSGN